MNREIDNTSPVPIRSYSLLFQTGNHQSHHLFPSHRRAVIMPPSTFRSRLPTGRHLAHKTLHHHVGPKPLQEVAHKPHIFLQGEGARHETLAILLLHHGAFKYLKLMQLDTGERQTRHNIGLCQNILSAFAWKPQNEMTSTSYAALCRSSYRTLRAGKIMTSANPLKGAVIAAFNTVLNHHIMLLGKGGKIVQFFLIHTVRPRAYHQPFDSRMGKSLLIPLTQDWQRCVCI